MSTHLVLERLEDRTLPSVNFVQFPPPMPLPGIGATPTQRQEAFSDWSQSIIATKQAIAANLPPAQAKPAPIPTAVVLPTAAPIMPLLQVTPPGFDLMVVEFAAMLKHKTDATAS